MQMIVQMPDRADREDGGRALITQPDIVQGDRGDDGFFLRLQSWSEDKEHPTLLALLGRRLRITIEEA